MPSGFVCILLRLLNKTFVVLDSVVINIDAVYRFFLLYQMIQVRTAKYCHFPLTFTWPHLNSNVGLEELEY